MRVLFVLSFLGLALPAIAHNGVDHGSNSTASAAHETNGTTSASAAAGGASAASVASVAPAAASSPATSKPASAAGLTVGVGAVVAGVVGSLLV